MVGKITVTLPETKAQKAILHNMIEKHLQVNERGTQVSSAFSF
jgi:hypothetical protein